MLLAQARLSTKDSKQSIVETFGEILPDVLIEPIVCRARPQHLQLLTWNGRNLAIADAVERGGVTYKPAARNCGLLSAVRFPKNSTPFGSPAKLAASISDFLSRYANLPPDGPSLLTSFALASWFADAFQVAPVLYLVGQPNEAGAVLRCLGCICRRPLLLADLDVAALGRLGPRLNPALLIAQRNLGRAVTHALRASNNRHFHIARGKDVLHTYGARAYSADSWSPHDPGLKMCLAPATTPLPVLSEAAEQEFANDFQGKLLRYRMENFRQVLRVKFDCRDFVPAIRDEVPTWLGPTAGCPGLREAVSAWLLQRSRDLEESRFSDLKCVVAEACLF